MLNCAVSLFGQALLTQHKVSIGISQLMVVLSDGRGVFGHGTPVSNNIILICLSCLTIFSFPNSLVLSIQPVMSNICQLTEMGVFVVFVIIDGLGEVRGLSNVSQNSMFLLHAHTHIHFPLEFHC